MVNFSNISEMQNNMKKIFFLFNLSVLLLATQSQSFAQAKAKKDKQNLTEAISPKQSITNGFADIVEELIPAVVNISALQDIASNSSNPLEQILSDGDIQKIPLLNDFKNQLENQFRSQQSQRKKIASIGSGFIISKEGFIVTNNHVIDDASDITVNLHDGSKYKAKLVGIDKKTDLALLKINPNKNLKFVKFGDSNKTRIGDWTIVIGNPYGLGESVSVGIISARGRNLTNGQSDDFLQTDAAINKGNSGGPLFNLKGEVVGVSTAIFSPSGGNVGIGFATPSSSASIVIQQLQSSGEVTRGWLGVSVQDVTDEIAESMKMDKTKGAFVSDVTKDSPADKAGIVPADIIIKFDDQEITEMNMLPKVVSNTPVGKVTKVTILRRDKIITLDIKIAKMSNEEIKKPIAQLQRKELPKSASQKPVTLLGMELNESTEKGLLISDINPKSEAANKGVIVGDIILSANQTPLKSATDLKKVIEESRKSTKKLFLFIKRSSANYAVVLSL